MRVFLEEFTRRLPHIRLVPGQRFEYLPNTSFRGPRALWAEWDPAENPERRDPGVLSGGRSFRIGAPVKDDILREVRVAAVAQEAQGIIRVDLADPRGRDLPGWTPGAHIDLVDGEIRRKYSLCGTCGDRRHLTIAILREAEGRGGSAHFHDTPAPGRTLHVAGPRNHFRLDEAADRYTLIAGGIGITPILAMADRLRELGRPYRLIYCGATRARMAFLDRVRRDHGDVLSLQVADEGGRLDLGALPPPEAGHQVYACGPERMLDALEAMAATWPEGALHVEHFNPRSGLLDPDKEHAFEVQLRDSGLTVQVASDQTLLEALTAAGVDVPCDCGEGLCGTCEVQVSGGEIDHRDKVLSRAERAEGRRMMSCCSRAKGKALVLDL